MDPHGNHIDQYQARRVASQGLPSRAPHPSQQSAPPDQFVPFPKSGEQPATPRMLRSVSGSIRNSKSDINRSSDDHVDSPHYVTSNEPSHSRDLSFQQQQFQQQQQQQQQQQYQQQAFQQQQQQQAYQQQAYQSHSRTPSSSRPQATVPNTPATSSVIPPPTPAAINPQQPTRKAELLPPAALATPPQKDAHSGSSVASKPPQTPQQTPHTPPNPQTPQQQQHHRGHQRQSSHAPPEQAQQPQQFHRKSIGDWDFVKTIGAGSMGKVKLAQHNATHELCAVKIIPRAAKVYQRAHSDDPPPATAQEAAQRHKEYEKELARDKRTIREGALGRLLFHPYICRLYEMVPMTNHYYMLFEHVEGGQMLDYIVAHGSLKEKNARKFARGIASALDYCHRNNVVHRDLKIENIMINEKGDIKIIDFGLSNLYSPKGLLKTYCGSLYFAAPELLCARPYIGPEVDIWSFGVVLYVLVCGKVPFDDSSVSVLHEKIKRGAVEYPSFLSKECVSLLSRMLVVDPAKRATLHEVSQHPWMNKGYEYRVSSYLPKRQPLSLPLDPEIVKTIASFELGSVQHITEELTNILTSVEYQMSCENWFKITEQGREYASASNAHILPDPTGGFHPLISIYFLVDEMKKRKKAKEEAVRAQYQQAQVQAREKQRQEAVHAETQAKNQAQALAQIQVQAQALAQAQASPPSLAPQSHSRQSSQNQHQTSQVLQDIKQPKESKTLEPEKTETLPSISYPEQAHTTFGASRTISAEDESLVAPVIPDQQPSSPRESSPLGESLDPNAGKSGAGFNSLLRRLSSKKYKTGAGSRGTPSPTSPVSSNHPPLPKVVLPQDSPVKLSPQSSYSSKRDPMVRRGVSMKVTAKEKSSSSRINLHPSANASSTQQPQYTEVQKPLAKPSENKKSHGRSSSTSTGQGKAHGFIPVEYLPPLPNLNTNNNTIVSNSNSLKPVAVTTSGRKLHPTARAKSVGHVRKESYQRNRQAPSQHPPLPNSLAAQNSDEVVGGEPSNNNDGFFDDVTLDDVEYQEIPQLTEDQIIEQFNEAKPNSMPSIEHCKTLFLKGFFSVQTTSTKPLPVIRYNIINVLSKLGVKFQEVKGGFVCAHTPSLQQQVHSDENSNNNSTILNSQYAESSETARGGGDLSSDQRELYGDAFKSTSSSFEQDKPPRIKTPEPPSSEASTKTPSRQPSLNLNTQTLSPPSNSSTKSHRSSNSIGGGHRRKFSIGNSILGTYRKKNGSQVMMPPNTPAAAKVARSLYPDEEDFGDEDLSGGRQHYDDDSVDSLNGLNIGGGSDMLISSRIEHKARHQHSPSTSSHSSKSKKSPLKFEIHIVKVPLVGLYGVQFKKLLGNTWNYKTLASQVLNELNL